MAFETGGLDDRVRLTLGADTVLICERYRVRASVFEQPEGFSLSMGWGDTVLPLLMRYAPNTEFWLEIAGIPTQTGFTDGYEVNTDEGASEITFEGRDIIQRLYDDHIEHERSYAASTYTQLVKEQLQEVGLDPNLLITTAAADRQVRAGVPLVELAPPVVVDQIFTDAKGNPVSGTIEQSIKSHLGERRLMFIRRYLDRAGLFLRASHSGQIILSAPNAAQPPVARIVRRRGDRPGAGNIKGARFRNNTRPRYSECVLYGRGGSKKYRRGKTAGAFVDDTMINVVEAGGDVAKAYAKRLVIRDANVQTTAQAEFLAARKLAEGRRDGWALSYRMSGHTTPSLFGGRCVWTPDTMVQVDDDEYGIHETLYVESCEYTRSPATETLVRLMRPIDLIFAEIE